jgi:hypothetical protein
MKGLNFRVVDRPSALLGGVLGIVGGSVLGYVLARKALSAKFDSRLNAEVEELKAHYNGHLRKLLGSEETGPLYIGAKRSWADVVKDTLENPVSAPVLRPKHDGYGAGPAHRNEGTGVSGDPVPDVPGEDASETLTDETDIVVVTPVDGNHVMALRTPGKPYVIGVAELGESPNPGWQSLTITYYAGDQVLADDKDQPIRDVRGTVGSVELITFGGPSGDPHIKYVRNEKLEIDFEIIYSKEAYADVVLNYGRPNKQGTTTG